MIETETKIREGVAVVTGAGRGLGRKLAIELTQKGVRVAGIGRNAVALAETAHACKGGLFLAISADVANSDEVRQGFSEIKRQMGRVTILINNAAIYPRKDFLQETPESFMETLQVNLGGIINCTHAALQDMTETGIGRIVDVGSFADLGPAPCSSAYSVSKGAARILTKALIADLSDRFPDIVMSVWMPGILATDMGMPDGLDPADAAKWGVSFALWHDRSLNGVIFERNQEILPPRSLAGRVKDLIKLRLPPKPRMVPGLA
ncbi:MAG: SDR family oxidoreductase [Hyphomicrobiales bacterium]|nr:SDR family oxidoreductase [Hyphomicrobiales bacterium]